VLIRGSNINGFEIEVPRKFEFVLPASPSQQYFHFETYPFLGLKLLCHPENTVFDIGCSYGVMTILILKLIENTGRVVSFEANPSVFQEAQELASANNLTSKVTFLNKFVGEKSGTATDFFAVPGPKSVASTKNPSILQVHSDAIRTKVDTISIDDFVEESAIMPDVCKIDVEGAEYVALKGMEHLLSYKSKAVDLVIETHGDSAIREIGGNLDRLVGYLEKMGYGMIDLTTGMMTTKGEYVDRYRGKIGHMLASKKLKNKRFTKSILSQAEAEINSIPPNFPPEVQDLIDRSKYQEACEQIEHLLASYPKDSKLNYYYAFCLHMLKVDHDRALRYYNIALQYGFDEYWVKYNRGSLLEHLGDLNGAIEDIKRALELKPGDIGATSILRSIQSKVRVD
jgi:FkbM family methyltransferase